MTEPDPRLRCRCPMLGGCAERATAEDLRCDACRTTAHGHWRPDGSTGPSRPLGVTGFALVPLGVEVDGLVTVSPHRGTLTVDLPLTEDARRAIVGE